MATQAESLRAEAARHRVEADRLEALAAGLEAHPSVGAAQERLLPRDWQGRYFSASEVVASTTAERAGIDNTPPDQGAWRALEAVVIHCADPLREAAGEPIRCSSGYRSKALNTAIKGASGSQHIAAESRGAALDLEMLSGRLRARELADLLAAHAPDFDQLIHYHPSRGGHIHVSYQLDGTNRRERRCAPKGGGYPRYTGKAGDWS